MGLKGLTIEEPVSGTNKFFAIGDVHGCLTCLEKLLEKLPINWGEDFVIFLGDYIDRGPNPRGVIEKVMELKKLYPQRIITLKGNHEQMFENFLKGKDVEVFLYNGGMKTLKDYYKEGKIDIPEEHIEFVRNLLYYFETPEYIFVHAGLRPGKSLYEQDEDDILWIRQSFYLTDYQFPKTIIFGHTPFEKPFIKEDRIGIDTGCVYGGYLTAISLPDKKFYQVNCREVLYE